MDESESEFESEEWLFELSLQKGQTIACRGRFDYGTFWGTVHRDLLLKGFADTTHSSRPSD